MADSIAASSSSSGPYFRRENDTLPAVHPARRLTLIIDKYQNAFHPYDLPERPDSYRLDMRTLAAAWMCLLAFAPSIGARQAARTAVGPPAQGWAVDRADLAGNVKFEPVLGRADAMVLRGNTHVVKTGLDFGDGTISFDLAPLAEGDFAAITFRRQSFTNHENIYLRLRRSGEFMAMQYAPRVNGSSTWQLYREFAVATDWPRDQWTRIRLEVRGSKMDVFVGEAKAPALTVPRLRNGTTGGEIGFWVFDYPPEHEMKMRSWFSKVIEPGLRSLQT